MNLIKLSISYIRQRKLSTALNVLLLGLGIATIVVLLLFSRQFQDNLVRNGEGINLVVGAKGSPLQLVLASIYHLDVPTGNIALTDARKIVRHPAVRSVIPLAMGDSYAGYRIIGCTNEYLENYSAEFAKGKLWKAPMEVVIGASVSAEKNLSIGDKLISVHGLDAGGHAHEEKSLVISGVLAPTGTVLDRLILTSVQTVWEVHAPQPDNREENHEEHGESHVEQEHSGNNHLFPFGQKSTFAIASEDTARQLTALLIRYSSPIAAVTFPRFVNAQTSLLAASPAVETTRLFALLGVGLDAVRAFALILIAAAALSIFVALYNALKERRFDLAVMRSLGASRGKLFQHVVLEGLLLASLGILAGLTIGHLATELLGNWFAETQQMSLTGNMFDHREIWLIAGALIIGIVAALLPAIQAYRSEIASTLAEK